MKNKIIKKKHDIRITNQKNIFENNQENWNGEWNGKGWEERVHNRSTKKQNVNQNNRSLNSKEENK